MAGSFNEIIKPLGFSNTKDFQTDPWIIHNTASKNFITFKINIF